jgi:tRNA pseudouridine55 synthase
MPVPPRGLDPSGLVLVDKPAGPSSFAVVRDLRERTGARAGHAGTLDPFATGLLLVLLGRSTKLAQRFVGLNKRYVTEVDLSGRTTTGDLEGEVLEERKPPSADELEVRLAALRGEVDLRVPAASAVKVGGQRAYRLHRRGEEVEMPIRRSTIHSLDIASYDGRRVVLDLLVGSGTYVRSIADELGGHCSTLRRTEVGPFRVEDADMARVIPPDEALSALD